MTQANNLRDKVIDDIAMLYEHQNTMLGIADNMKSRGFNPKPVIMTPSEAFQAAYTTRVQAFMDQLTEETEYETDFKLGFDDLSLPFNPETVDFKTIQLNAIPSSHHPADVRAMEIARRFPFEQLTDVIAEKAASGDAITYRTDALHIRNALGMGPHTVDRCLPSIRSGKFTQSFDLGKEPCHRSVYQGGERRVVREERYEYRDGKRFMSLAESIRTFARAVDLQSVIEPFDVVSNMIANDKGTLPPHEKIGNQYCQVTAFKKKVRIRFSVEATMALIAFLKMHLDEGDMADLSKLEKAT